jgi:hypothetical protein
MNRKQRRAKNSTNHIASAEDIPLSSPDYNNKSQDGKTKTLLEIAAERQAELLGSKPGSARHSPSANDRTKPIRPEDIVQVIINHFKYTNTDTLRPSRVRNAMARYIPPRQLAECHAFHAVGASYASIRGRTTFQTTLGANWVHCFSYVGDPHFAVSWAVVPTFYDEIVVKVHVLGPDDPVTDLRGDGECGGLLFDQVDE